MPTNSNSSYRIFLYPIVGLLLAACGAASVPATSQAAITTVAQVGVTPSATTVSSATPTIMPTTTTAPATASTSTATVVPTATATFASPPPPTTVPDQPTAVPTPATRQAPPNAAAKVSAEIKLFQYKPNILEIKTGTTVVWTNQDAIEHSVTSGTPPAASSAFDSGFFTQGQSFTFTFTKPGTYSYFCMRHNSMTGTVKVTAP